MPQEGADRDEESRAYNEWGREYCQVIQQGAPSDLHCAAAADLRRQGQAAMLLGPERLAGLTGILSHTAAGVTSRGPRGAGGPGESRRGNAGRAGSGAAEIGAEGTGSPAKSGPSRLSAWQYRQAGGTGPRRPPGQQVRPGLRPAQA